VSAELHRADDGVLVVAVSWAIVEALEEIYRRHAAAVYALARRLLRDRMRAAAVVLEVFVDLWSDPDRFDPQEGCLRSHLLARTYALAAVDPGVGQAPADASTWSQLSDEESQAIELACFPSATYVDIAMLLARPEETVKAAIGRGLTRIRSM
jgi:DNA-directed RNA polymerase specialized sigma24 family protein